MEPDTSHIDKARCSGIMGGIARLHLAILRLRMAQEKPN